MSSSIVDDKRALRRTLKARLSTLPPVSFMNAGLAVATSLPSPPGPLSRTGRGGTIALFASRDDEIDVHPIETLARRLGLRLAVPRIDGDDLAFHVVDDDIHDLPRDRFGIPTPPASLPAIALRDCALVVVPGLGFDEHGGRLGYGRGYYDRALRDVDLERVVAIGLDEQLVQRVPVDDHDVRLRWLCTPARGLRRTG